MSRAQAARITGVLLSLTLGATLTPQFPTPSPTSGPEREAATSGPRPHANQLACLSLLVLPISFSEGGSPGRGPCLLLPGFPREENHSPEAENLGPFAHLSRPCVKSTPDFTPQHTHKHSCRNAPTMGV